MPSSVPLISLQANDVPQAIGAACRDLGFFYVKDHGVSPALEKRLEEQSRRFFALPQSDKEKIAMSFGGKAWRGYFPLGAELTSGKPDLKEGLYFGAELASDHPSVRAGLPLHGANLFPSAVPELRATVLEYLTAMTDLSHRLMAGIALSLSLEANYFHDRYTGDPLILFRVFNYPRSERVKAAGFDPGLWGVGEHTDYGVLTILKQDGLGGLEVRSHGGWTEAKPIPGTFVVNIGDMLDRMTGGLYRSTPHRVKNLAARDRQSFPFFFDPNFHAKVEAIPLGHAVREDKDGRWDKASVHEFKGTYGDYLLGKVGKVFPGLKQEVKV